ncbi:sugar phosphate isomerase/epimerase [Lentzea tibetensis]|uniref:Sugar phosphate isomerase/epimerase n=1 Tax=Lentzea tibetensis TaxID=2591470 RepID=A0A563F2G7_9PSEU|nr:sugar phosphate isomerase/epimerase family protein [Lentzea tibetensis]TWP54150.1 sugar phosphate isomerase/epimerase [Lentzea tibetensis]
MWSIGVSTWVWRSPLTDHWLAELAPRVRGWGFDVIELPVEQPGDWDPGRASALLRELGLGATVCLVMPPGRELVAADRATITETQDYLRHCVDVAKAVGSEVIAGPAYSSVGRTWLADPGPLYEELRTNLAPVGEYAAEQGIQVAVEPLNRYETSLVNTVQQCLEALGELPGCGIALDTYHLNIEESDPVAAIRAAGRHIAHVQVCANDRGTPGDDHLDWPGMLSALADTGYRGPLCIESFTPDNKTIATAASIWRPLARSQDALAVDGLAFLREAVTKF